MTASVGPTSFKILSGKVPGSRPARKERMLPKTMYRMRIAVAGGGGGSVASGEGEDGAAIVLENGDESDCVAVVVGYKRYDSWTFFRGKKVRRVLDLSKAE